MKIYFALILLVMLSGCAGGMISDAGGMISAVDITGVGTITAGVFALIWASVTKIKG